jgi:hypothetical protein
MPSSAETSTAGGQLCGYLGMARSAATVWARPVARIFSATASSSDCVREAMTTSAPTRQMPVRWLHRAAAATGDDGHFVVKTEPVKDHLRPFFCTVAKR